ncbi:MAG TPA: helix-turn-helix domain-containing protein [Trinickia sp.]|nr:helix-turn-helix domain-containing protein [Trinickia sp.]
MAKRIAILVFDAFSLVEVSSVAEVFRLADELEGESTPPGHDGSQPQPGEPDQSHDPYEIVIVSGNGGSVASSGSMRVWSENIDAYASTGFDVLFVAGGPGAARVKEDESFLRRLRVVLPKTRVVKAIAEGYSILAAANASAGAERIGTSAPSVPLAVGAARSAPLAEQPVALDDPLGPVAAALSVVKRDRGPTAAREISERSMPGAWRRLGAVLGELDEGGAREKINAAARWIRENYGRPISVAKAAQVAAMSERSFLRRFKSQMGLTPSEYLLRARLDASCLLLVATDLPVDKIARRCGVGSGDGLAKIFRKRLSISPTEYRVTERRRSNER